MRWAWGIGLSAMLATSCSLFTDVDPLRGAGSNGDSGVGNDGSVPPDGSVGPDGATCGDCFGGACVQGVCGPVAMNLGKALSSAIGVLEVDSKSVYFMDNTTIGAIDLKVPYAARTISTESGLSDIKVRGGSVYFANFADPGANGVYSCLTQGASCNGRKKYGVASTYTYGVAVDDTYLYASVNAPTSEGGVYAIHIVNNSSALQATAPSSKKIATDGKSIAWVTGVGIDICPAQAACGTPKNPYNGSVADLAFGTDGYLYLATTSGISSVIGTLVKSFVVASNVVAVRADATHVYWLTQTTLQRCSLASDCIATPSAVETMVTGLKNAFGLAVGADSVFYDTRGDGLVWRLKK